MARRTAPLGVALVAVALTLTSAPSAYAGPQPVDPGPLVHHHDTHPPLPLVPGPLGQPCNQQVSTYRGRTAGPCGVPAVPAVPCNLQVSTFRGREVGACEPPIADQESQVVPLAPR